MLLTALPYVIGWLRPAPGWHFSGFVFALDDGNSYIGKMALGARGDWLFHLFYTTEPHHGILAFWFHFVLGKLAVLVNPPADTVALHERLVAWYHGARLACGFLLLMVSYRFCAEFLAARWQRRLAFVMIALGGGLGWLAAIAGARRLPLDFYSPEAFTFLSLYGLPHLSAARACLLLGLLAYLPVSAPAAGYSRSLQPVRAGQAAALRRGALGGVAWLFLGFIQPLYLIVGYAILGAHQAALWLGRRPNASGAVCAGMMIGMSAPMVLYTALAFRGDPILGQWQRQNLILSPPPADYALAWGLWIVPAIVTAAHLVRPGRVAASGRSGRRWLLLAWVLVAFALIYAPYNLQRRFAEGVQVPLVCLAVLGFAAGLRPHPALRRLAPAATVALAIPSTAVLVLGGVVVARQPSQPVFMPADTIAVFRWLGEHAEPDSAVLAPLPTSNALPAYAPVRVYAGHGPETAFYDRKAAEVQAFFDGAATDGLRQRLLASAGIDYVVFEAPPGPGPFDPSRAPYLQVAYQAGGAGVYRVIETELAAR
jgi:hypothetical protein